MEQRLCSILKQSIENALGDQTPKGVIILLDNNLWKEALQLLPDNIRYGLLLSLVESIFKQLSQPIEQATEQ